ncbi:MAG: InlB B-repeat-containing protein [Alloprevotella sp.]|nr:InlB B-repeat-containing protein [Alloprevotella sp.]MBR1653138.1 InlB B-repeat-containing protein [Alloprevotella sp.]
MYKQLLKFKTFLLVCLLVIVGTNVSLGQTTKTGSWTFGSSAVEGWTCSPQTSYCNGYYTGKNSDAVVSNKSIDDFSNVDFSSVTSASVEITVSGMTNSGTNSYTVSLIDKDGKEVGSPVTKTDSLGTGTSITTSGSVKSSSVTLTPVAGATGYKISIKAKTVLAGTSYSLTYTAGPTYSISAVSNDNDMGSVSLSGKIITASPNDGYRVSTTTPYEITTGTATVEQNGNEFTVTPSTDCTVQINFEAIPTYAATILSPDNGTLVVKNGDVAINSGDAFAAGTVLTIVPTPADGYYYKNWQYRKGDGNWTTKTTSFEYTMDENPVSFRANFAEKLDVNWSVNGQIRQTDKYGKGETIVFPANPSDIDDMKFVGWVREAITGTTDEEPTYVTSANMEETALTFYAVFANVVAGDAIEVKDELTTTTFGSPTSYTTWSNKAATDGSGAKYAGESAGGTNYIQIRATSPSGIVTTVSGGKLKKVEVVWNSSNDPKGRTINIYGSNTAYTSPTQLYNTINGEKLGSITSTTGTELDITGDYAYIGIRSNANALYLDKVSITWEVGTPDSYSDYCTTVAEDERTPVNLTSFSAAQTEIVKGNTTTTSVANNQSGWTAAYTYSSDNEPVAMVDENGVITAVSKGSATITVTLNVDKNDSMYKKGETRSMTLDVTVVNPSHTATFYNNGEVLSQISLQEEEAITFPAQNPTVDGYTFVGWATTEIDGTQSSAPTTITSATMETSDANFYAVYASESETDGWQKITDLSKLEAGVYALLTTSNYYAFNGSISSGHGQVTSQTFSFTNDIATSAPAGTCELTLEKVEGGYKIYNSDKGYLYATDSKSGSLSWHSTENSYWRVLNSGENIVYNFNTAYLRSYSNNSFRTYSSTSSGQVLTFAKKIKISVLSEYRTYIPPTSTTITLNAACTDGEMIYGTYSSSLPFIVSDDIIVSEIAIVDDELYVEQYETGDVVPANTGVMVSALEGGNYTVLVASTEGSSVLGEDNRLRPTGDSGIEAASMAEKDVNCLYYRLTMHNGTTIGYWWGAEDGAAFNMGANKAYLAISEAQAARMMGFGFDGINTAISFINSIIDTNAPIYNVLGQRVAPTTKGILIQNGKKYINK